MKRTKRTDEIETPEETLLEIAKGLGNIQKMVHKLLDMEPLEQEKILLDYYISACSEHEELTPVKEACEQVLKTHPDGVNYYETTMIDEAIELLQPIYKQALPPSWFEKDVLFYKLGYSVIEESFKTLEDFELERRFALIIEELKHRTYNSFVNNPNFKGDNPYYKRHYNDFQHSKKLTRELLDKEFSNYIDFFNGD